MLQRRFSHPDADRMVRNRIRRYLLVGIFVASAAVTVWANATSPLNQDAGFDIVFFLPVLAALFRLARESVAADPEKDSIRIRNFLHSHQVPWGDIEQFELTKGRFLLAKSEYITCVLKSGARIRIQSAGRFIQPVGPYDQSLTGRRTLRRITQELNARRTEHEHA